MKKRLLFMFVLALFSVLLAACGDSEETKTEENLKNTQATTSGSTEVTAEPKALRVGSTGQSYPNGYKEGDKLVGFDVETIEVIAEKLGYSIEWVNADFSGLMGQLESGKIDTIANAVGVTEERKEKYLFTNPYSYAGVTIVTHKDNTDINTLDDLKGKTVSGVLGSNNVKNLEKFDTNGEIKIRTYENRDGAQLEVINKRVDGYVNAKASLLAEIQKNDLPLKFVGEPFIYEDVAFPFQKSAENEALVAEIDEIIQQFQEDGTLKAISEKYYGGEDITVKVEE